MIFSRQVCNNSPKDPFIPGDMKPQILRVLLCFHSFLFPAQSLSFFDYFSLHYPLLKSLISSPGFCIFVYAHIFFCFCFHSYFLFIFPFLLAFLFQFWLPHSVLFIVAFCHAFTVCRLVFYFYFLLSLHFLPSHFILPHLISPLYSVYMSPVILHALPHPD